MILRRLTALFWASGLLASSPAFWEMSSYQDFVKGKFESVALGRNGALSVAPKLDPLFTSGQAYIWSIAQGPDGVIYAGTGNSGRLYQLNAAGQSSVLWSAPQPEIFAVAAGPAGVVYAGTSPNGKIYRIQNGQASEFFDPKSTYIWALAVAPDGSVFAGTGSEGKIFHITSPGQGEEYYATGQANVTGLAFDREGRLLAGSEPNGILYRITAKDRAFVLYDSSLPEIRAMAVAPDGSVYAVGLGGSVAKKSQSASQPAAGSTVTETPTVTTSITVTAEAAQAGSEIKPAEAAKPPPAAQPAAAPAATTVTAELTGIEKSAIYKIHPDNTVETLFSSKEENVYDVLASGADLLFCTDVSGRIYRLTADRRLTLVVQTNDAEVTRLFRSGNSVLAATGTGGRIYRLGDAPAASGSYESAVYDAGSISRWGRVHWQGTGDATLRTRTGNSLRPDRTWTEWSAPLTSASGSPVTSFNARYIQWKADLRNGAVLESVSVAYLPQNNPPAVRSITVLTTVQPATQSAKASPASSAAATPYTMTVTDTGDPGASASTGTPTQTLSRAAAQQMILSWQADDPDGDKLVYSLFFRGEGERDWKLLKDNLHENTFTLDGDGLADGRYFFRVLASDREVNPAPGALQAELVSSPVLIDNTPPVVTIGSLSAAGLDFEAADSASPLRRCEYALDGGPWTPIAPVDGILDSRSAHFHIDLTKRPPGEHLLVVRAFDSGNNAGLAKIVLH